MSGIYFNEKIQQSQPETSMQQIQPPKQPQQQECEKPRQLQQEHPSAVS